MRADCSPLEPIPRFDLRLPEPEQVVGWTIEWSTDQITRVLGVVVELIISLTLTRRSYGRKCRRPTAVQRGRSSEPDSGTLVVRQPKLPGGYLVAERQADARQPLALRGFAVPRAVVDAPEVLSAAIPLPSPAKHIKAALPAKPKAKRYMPDASLLTRLSYGNHTELNNLWALFFRNSFSDFQFMEEMPITTAISVEDVRREVNILTLCEGGELLDRTISRSVLLLYLESSTLMPLMCYGSLDGEDILRKMQRLSLFKSLSVVGFCHLQGFVHCDLKPEVKD
ncbi:hypothetical protein EJ110_NYTH04278 [Nymphaea thermarum]|nr:hypothetical protein EJ110_NYTH04278 [Nymphaea thermarum]